MQLWRMDTPVSDAALAVLTSMLDERETQRANALVNPQHRTRFITRRGLLRQILAAQLDLAADQIHFTYGPQGKPSLCPKAHPQTSLCFNLSHSNGLAILGITHGQEIGVDLEAINTRRNIQGIGERYFHPNEWQHIAAMPEADQPAAFFDNWACKEAIVKATGGGIVSGIGDFIIQNISPAPGLRHCSPLSLAAQSGEQSTLHEPPVSLTSWTLRTLEWMDRQNRPYRAAVALPGNQWQLADTVLDATADLGE